MKEYYKMMKSKIPLPSKRSAQSSIPLPTKCLGTQSKRLPSNSKEALVSKKPVSIKQVPSNFSKVREKENIVKRLPSSKSYDSKNEAALSKKSSFRNKKVADTVNKLTTVNKFIKQTKPVPVRPPKVIVSRIESNRNVTKKENESKRVSTFKSHNDKTAVPSSNEPKTTNKSAIQSKRVPMKQKPSKFSKVSEEEENIVKSLPGKKKEENFSVAASLQQINVATKSGVDDSEFQKSSFFKSLILNERELSPGIIKYCSEAKFTSSKANLLQVSQKASPRFLSADEFVEEVKRTSSKYYRLNGRLVLRSPNKANLLQARQKASPRFLTADEFVEEVRRTSSKYYRLNGRLVLRSPNMSSRNSFQRISKDIVSVKENLDIKLVDEDRRLSEFRRQTSQNVDILRANRRWTCSVPSKSIANMNTTEIAAELQRISEMRRKSGAQLYKKTRFLEHHHSMEKLNPSKRVLQELALLTAKKRDKMKKKVTFLIPSSGSPDLATSTSISEAKLSDISEGSSNNCTPELDLGNGRVLTKSQAGGSTENVEDTPVITTPELNLTLPFNLSHKNDVSTSNYSSNNQAVSQVVKDISKNNSEQYSQNSKLTDLKSDLISSEFSSLKIDENVCFSQIVPDNNLTSFEPYSTNTNSNLYSEFSNLKSTDCLFKSVHKLAEPTCYQPVNETEKFCVNTEKKIYTPHPFNLHSKSNLPPSVSPSFLSSKFTTLNSIAPICTPYVLKTLSQSPEVNLSQVRQRLDFNEKPNHLMGRRESQIILQTIPTIQKMNDLLCDQECITLSSQSSESEIFFRNLTNPIASILNNGDEMHFLPINSP